MPDIDVFPVASGFLTALPPNVPAQFAGVPPVTLQNWLTQAQQALHELKTGAKAVTVLYNSGDGTRQVSYLRTSQAALQAYVRELATALGLAPQRRAIGVRFG